MTPRAPLRSTVLAVLVAALAGGCTGGADELGPPAPEAGGELIEVDSRPHFRGARPVLLAAGSPALGTGEESCRDEDAPIWVCDQEAQDRYLVGEDVEASLREARMDVAGGGTSWTVTLRFGGADRRDVVAVREEARGRGAMVLVLDEQREVLVSATVPDVDPGVIHLSGLSKAEAWDTVETFNEG